MKPNASTENLRFSVTNKGGFRFSGSINFTAEEASALLALMDVYQTNVISDAVRIAVMTAGGMERPEDARIRQVHAQIAQEVREFVLRRTHEHFARLADDLRDAHLLNRKEKPL